MAQYVDYYRLSRPDRLKLTALRVEKQRLLRQKDITVLAVAVVESWFTRSSRELSADERRLREAVRSWQEKVRDNQLAIDRLGDKSRG